MALTLEQSIDKLGADFPNLNWNFKKQEIGNRTEQISQWLGGQDEDIMVCVYKGRTIHEPFHRQDFFFLNYAYAGSYSAYSYKFDNQLTVAENECYIGQPFSGYALFSENEKDIVIIGVLIKKEVFYRNFLQVISTDSRLLHFFLDPKKNDFSDEFIHLENMKDHAIRTQIEMMALEYANKKEDTQEILRPMTLTLLIMLAREFKVSHIQAVNEDAADRIVKYMEEHVDVVTLELLSEVFSYHPSYVSSLLSKKKGRTYSEILLAQRMARAVFLMQKTDLSLEEIAPIVGYDDKSSFYKAFRKSYGKTPREYVQEISSKSNI